MQAQICVSLPERLLERLRSLGLDPEAFIVDLVLRELNLDPHEEALVHVELAEKFLEEGKTLLDKDPVQASEKLYKAAEECVKALALHFRLDNVLTRVRERGRWTVTDLERAIREIAKRVGDEVYDAWDHANYLHVWGFHEAKLDSEAVRARLPHIEKFVYIVREHIRKETQA